jgi:hypothetical protein
MSCTFIPNVSNQYRQHPCETDWTGAVTFSLSCCFYRELATGLVHSHSFTELLLLSRTAYWTGAFTQFRWGVAFIANCLLDWCIHTVSLSCCFYRKLPTGQVHSHSFAELLFLSQTTYWTGAFTRFRSGVSYIANYQLEWCVHTVSLNSFSCPKLQSGRLCNIWKFFYLLASHVRSSVTKVIPYVSVSQTVVRGPQVVLGFGPCGPLRLNISPKKIEKIKLTWIAYHTL